MKEKKSVAEVLEEYQNLLTGHNCVITREMEFREMVIKENLCNLSKSTKRTYSVLNLHTRQLEDNFGNRHRKELQPAGILSDCHSLRQRYRDSHPKDLYVDVESDMLFLLQLMELPLEVQKDFSMSNLRQIRNPKGSFDLYLMHTSLIECDEQGNPWLLLSESEHLPDYSYREISHKRTFKLNNRHDQRPINKPNRYNLNDLSDQELIVLRMSGEQNPVKEIAAKLSLSIPTIKSHRSEIMRKFNAPTMPLACLLARKLGII